MDAGPSDTPTGTVVVLVKDFATAKARLAPALDPQRRAALAEEMANRVLAAAASIAGLRGIVVVGDSPAVIAWAEARGARGLLQRDAGLNAAAAEGWAAAAGGDWTMLAHADLADPSALAHVVGRWRPGCAVLVPDRRGDGTNVMVLPAHAAPRFDYGPGSYGRHRAMCADLGLEVESVTDTSLGHDVDEPDDLDGGEVPGQ